MRRAPGARAAGAAPLRDAYGDGKGDNKPVEWVKVHLLPQYAYFNHAVHARANRCARRT